jgi:tellurite methyltransferase
MPSTVHEWDSKHLASVPGGPAEPASIVREFLSLLPLGPALDLACGTGRHTLLLAARQQPVVAVDWSPVALDILEERARARQIEVRRAGTGSITPPSAERGIDLLQADLEHAILPAAAFDLILCFYYLQRSLFPQIEQALRPGGMLVFETYTRAQLEFASGPRNPAHLLDPGELRTAFPSLHMLFYRELRAGQGIASIVAQKPKEGVRLWRQ